MRAMVFCGPREPAAVHRTANAKTRRWPIARAVAACAVCRTDLHVVDGELPNPKLPQLDAAIIFAPAGELVPQALRAVAKGGTVVCGSNGTYIAFVLLGLI